MRQAAVVRSTTGLCINALFKCERGTTAPVREKQFNPDQLSDWEIVRILHVGQDDGNIIRVQFRDRRVALYVSWECHAKLKSFGGRGEFVDRPLAPFWTAPALTFITARIQRSGMSKRTM
jgi:hypothetical protein